MGINTLQPFVKFHQYDQALVDDIQALNASGYPREDIFVLRWAPDRHHDYHGRKYGRREDGAIGDIDSKAQLFANGGEELRTKLEHLGVDREEAAALVRRLQETDATCLLVVRKLRDRVIDLG